MIRIGPSGTSGLGYEVAFEEISKIGLNALEVAFTYGVRMSNEEAKRIGEIAKKANIALSVHGPYYINLSSKEKHKQEASIKRILDSCEKAHYLGASPVVYHSGFYQKQDPKLVKEMITQNTALIMDKIKENDWKTTIAPELMGKDSQFGTIPDLLELRKATGCNLTVDFAHQKARNIGKINYADMLDSLKSLKHIHAHFSGIEWTDKGEKRHLPLTKEEIIPLAKELKKRNVDITIINESPDPIGDAELIKEVFDEMDGK